jgi:hypothetical protein
MSLSEIRRRYGVPARRGARVTFEGEGATITSARGHHLRLRFDGRLRTEPAKFHPLWEIDYLDGVDHGAEYDRRFEAFNASFSTQPKAET